MPDRLHLPDGRPAPDAAPIEYILDHEDLVEMRSALVKGHAVSLSPNGRVYVHKDLEGAWTSRSEEFIEAKLGDMRQFIARGFSVKIDPTGRIDARSADGKFEYRSELHPDPTGTGRGYIRAAVTSGANVAILPDGTVQVTHDGAPPRRYAEYVDRVMAQLDHEVNMGRMAQQAADGNAFVIRADGEVTNFHYQEAPRSSPPIRFPEPGTPDPLAAVAPPAPPATDALDGTGDASAVADAIDPVLADPFDAGEAHADATAADLVADPARSTSDDPATGYMGDGTWSGADPTAAGADAAGDGWPANDLRSSGTDIADTAALGQRLDGPLGDDVAPTYDIASPAPYSPAEPSALPGPASPSVYTDTTANDFEVSPAADSDATNPDLATSESNDLDYSCRVHHVDPGAIAVDGSTVVNDRTIVGLMGWALVR